MKAMWAVLLAISATGVARADTVFDFTVNGIFNETEPYSTVGKFYATDLGPGSNGNFTYERYLVTGASGTTGGVAITGVPPVYSGVLGNDNMLYVSNPYIEFNGTLLPPYTSTGFGRGVGFTLADGALLGIRAGSSGYQLYTDNFPLDYAPSVSVTFSLPETAATPTPEPGSMALVGTGALGMVEMVRRRIRGRSERE